MFHVYVGGSSCHNRLFKNVPVGRHYLLFCGFASILRYPVQFLRATAEGLVVIPFQVQSYLALRLLQLRVQQEAQEMTQSPPEIKPICTRFVINEPARSGLFLFFLNARAQNHRLELRTTLALNQTTLVCRVSHRKIVSKDP